MGNKGGKIDSVDVNDCAAKNNFTTDQVQFLIDEWKKLGHKNKVLNKKEFNTLLQKVHAKFPHPGLEDDYFRDNLWQLFDTNHDNKLQFDECVSGLSVLSKGDFKQKASLVFDSIDLNGDGFLTHDELKKSTQQGYS